MKAPRFPLSLAFGLCLLAAPELHVRAQEAKDVTIEGQVKAGVHKFKLDTKTLYEFEIKGKNFSPSVSLVGGFIPNTADFFKERNTFRGVFAPMKNQEHTLVITPNTLNGVPEGLLDYTITLKVMVLDENPLLKKEDKLTEDDPKYQQSFRKTSFKSYSLKMTAGKTYVIDMVRPAGADNPIDPYLYLESPKKLILMQNDDGGGFPHARIIFRPTADGEYRIIASGLSDKSSLGDYVLTVRTLKSEK